MKATKKAAPKKTAAKKKGRPYILEPKTVKVRLDGGMVFLAERLHGRLKKIDPKLGLAELLRVLIGWALLQHQHNRKRAAARRRGQRAAARAIAAGMAKPKTIEVTE